MQPNSSTPHKKRFQNDTNYFRLADALADRTDLPRGTLVNFQMLFNVYMRIREIDAGKVKRPTQRPVEVPQKRTPRSNDAS